MQWGDVFTFLYIFTRQKYNFRLTLKCNWRRCKSCFPTSLLKQIKFVQNRHWYRYCYYVQPRLNYEQIFRSPNELFYNYCFSPHTRSFCVFLGQQMMHINGTQRVYLGISFRLFIPLAEHVCTRYPVSEEPNEAITYRKPSLRNQFCQQRTRPLSSVLMSVLFTFPEFLWTPKSASSSFSAWRLAPP